MKHILIIFSAIIVATTKNPDVALQAVSAYQADTLANVRKWVGMVCKKEMTV